MAALKFNLTGGAVASGRMAARHITFLTAWHLRGGGLAPALPSSQQMDGPLDGVPTSTVLYAVAEHCKRSLAPALIDLETAAWSPYSDTGARLAISLLNELRERAPGIRFGWYNIPFRHFDLTRVKFPGLTEDEAEREIRRTDSRLSRVRGEDGRWADEGVMDNVDYLAPCWYAFPAVSQEEWERKARFSLDRCRHYQKQVYPALSWRWNGSNTSDNGIIPIERWRRMVSLAAREADGMMLFDTAYFWNGRNTTLACPASDEHLDAVRDA